MNWIQRQLMQAMLLKMDGEPSAAGGGGKADDKTDMAAILAEMKKNNEAMAARLEALEGKKNKEEPNPKPDEKTLAEKAEAERVEKETQANREKTLEAAIEFTSGLEKWTRDHARLLPKNFPNIIAQAEKENYSSKVEKASAIKVSLVQEYFNQQANLDLLTPTQKIELEDWKNLVKTEKEKGVGKIWTAIFEPSFESVKREAKAKQVGNGQDRSSEPVEAYKHRMQELSEKHYLKKGQ